MYYIIIYYKRGCYLISIGRTWLQFYNDLCNADSLVIFMFILIFLYAPDTFASQLNCHYRIAIIRLMVLCRGASPPYPHWGLKPQTPAITLHSMLLWCDCERRFSSCEFDRMVISIWNVFNSMRSVDSPHFYSKKIKI